MKGLKTSHFPDIYWYYHLVTCVVIISPLNFSGLTGIVPQSVVNQNSPALLATWPAGWCWSWRDSTLPPQLIWLLGQHIMRSNSTEEDGWKKLTRSLYTSKQWNQIHIAASNPCPWGTPSWPGKELHKKKEKKKTWQLWRWPNHMPLTSLKLECNKCQNLPTFRWPEGTIHILKPSQDLTAGSLVLQDL